MMSADGNGEVASLTPLEDRRTTEEDRIDLDYDEDISNDAPCEEKSSNSEDGEKPTEETKNEDDEKEEGELEEGELTSSDDEPPVINKDSSKSVSNISGPSKDINSRLTKPSNGKPGETAWERGLREAREAMRRANKVREEPDFEVKRLVAAPSVRRSSRNNTDSDGSASPMGRRRNLSRSISPRTIPSLLDLKTSPPPRRVPPKEYVSHHNSRHLRPIQRPSPCYSSASNRSSPRRYSRIYIERRRKNLGPQVIYPNGRPCPKREPERERDRDRRDRGRRRESSPRRRDRENFPRKKDNREKSRNNSDTKHRKISLSVSPISSDSDLSPCTLKTLKKVKGSRNDLAGVNDPWARKWKGESGKFKRKRRSSSSSSSASSNSSRSTIPDRRKAHRSSSVSSSSSDSDNDNRKKYRRKISPIRSNSRRRNNSTKKISAERNPVDEFFTKKKSDLPAAFKKRSRKRSSSVSGDEKGIVAVSGSESEKSISTVSSAESSPKLYAKPRPPKEKSPSPISDDSKSSPSPPPPPPAPKLEDISPPPPPSSPSPKRAKVDNDDNRTSKKRKLMEQLREVEEELEKRRAAQMETAH